MQCGLSVWKGGNALSSIQILAKAEKVDMPLTESISSVQHFFLFIYFS